MFSNKRCITSYTGASINQADKYGRTPLHVAAAVDYPEMVHFLVQRGADIHAKTGKELQTPIHFAARNDATSSLKMLMKCGACITDKDFKQRTALQVCTNDWRKFSMLIRFCRKKKCISVGGCAIIDTITQSSCQKSTSVGAPPTL